MSFAALAWAAKCRPGSASRKLVLFALADRHNEEVDGAYPSTAWIAEFTGLNRKTVIASLSDLEALKLIEDSGERRGDTRQIKLYRLHLERVPETVQFRKRNSSEKVAKGTQKRDTDTVRTTKPKKDKPSLVAREIPDDWQPAEFGADTQSRKVVDGWPPGEVARQIEHFRAHHRKNGSKWKDWQSAWSTWVLNARNFGNGRSGSYPVAGNKPGSDLGRTAEAAIDIWGDPRSDLGAAARFGG